MSLFLILFQALALLTAPVEGDTVSGQVNLTGTANDPQFARYELAFAYDPNLTDTWFEIAPPATTPVTTGSLGIWDTTPLTAGTYMLRLRVFSIDSNSPTEVIVRNIQVQNDAPTPTPGTGAVTAPPIATTPPSTAAVTALPIATATPSTGAVTAPPAQEPTTSSPLPAFLDLSAYTTAFCNGVYLTAAAFLIIATYVIARDRIRGPLRKWIRRILSDIRKP